MGLSYGLAIVLPIVATFFAAFALLEDSGYLPRLAVMSDRVFRLMGLNGKAVLPMVLGLGCDTMATLTTRILPTKRSGSSSRCSWRWACPARRSSGWSSRCWPPCPRRGLDLVRGGGRRLFGRLARGPGGARGAGDFLLELPPMRLPRSPTCC